MTSLARLIRSAIAEKLQKATAFRRFVRCEVGNVAMIFAIAAVPTLIAIGAAIDYTRSVAARSAMQAALDATALMLAQDAASMTPADLTTKAHTYFNAIYTNADATGVTVTATYTA